MHVSAGENSQTDVLPLSRPLDYDSVKTAELIKVKLTLQVPDNTPKDAKIYLTGDFDDWSGGGAQGYQFHPQAIGNFALTFETPAFRTLQFKVTRGSWQTAEFNALGKRSHNRVIFARNQSINAQIKVHNWRDLSAPSANPDAEFWQTEVFELPTLPSSSDIRLRDPGIIRLLSGQRLEHLGTTAFTRTGEDISTALQTSGQFNTNIPGDYTITYTLDSEKQPTASPQLQLIRVLGAEPTNYSLRPVGSTPSHLGYIEQLPAEYGLDQTKTYPLFIYHHGAGGDAASLNNLREESLYEMGLWGGGPARMAMMKDWNTESPLIVLSPQRSHFHPDMERINAFVEFASTHYQVDPERIYMGGFSLGAMISWQYAIDYPEKLAAIVPFAGGLLPQFSGDICRMSDVAVWAFHSIDDNTVDLSETQLAVKSLNKCKPKYVPRLTLFDGLGHQSHQHVLELRGMTSYLKTGYPFRQNLYAWLLKQRR